MPTTRDVRPRYADDGSAKLSFPLLLPNSPSPLLASTPRPSPFPPLPPSLSLAPDILSPPRHDRGRVYLHPSSTFLALFPSPPIPLSLPSPLRPRPPAGCSIRARPGEPDGIYGALPRRGAGAVGYGLGFKV